MIVIINGPLGIGKSSVSWELNALFESAVMLDGDYLGAVHPFEIYDEERIEYLYQTLRQVVTFHVEMGGYRNFVINYVFETPESLARLRHLLSDLDDVIYAFRLVCEETEMERRIHQRARGVATDPHRVPWELDRFRELLTIQDQAALRGDMGYVIDTTRLNVREVAQAVWDNIHEQVDLAPYDSAWPAAFEDESERIQDALGGLAVAVHHIGSTAIPGLVAKPVIDIMVVVADLDDARVCIPPLHELGYTFVDYPQNMDRRFFRKGEPRSHHLHIVERGNAELADHLDFRDALRGDVDLTRQYAELKQNLAAMHKNDRATYSENKGEFVAAVLATYRHQEG